MSEQGPLTPQELARQVRIHLASLAEAGVEWLPAAGPPPPVDTDDRPAGQPAAAEAAPTPGRVPAAAPPAAAAVTPEAPLVTTADLFTTAGPELTPDQRRTELQVLAEQVAGCSKCPELFSTRTQTVFGEGALGPELCFVGEAPGFNEDQQGRPFVGDAGQLLNKIIAACGFRREEVYICNILKCRPPRNDTPTPVQAANCRGFLEYQLELVRPKFLCALGACAAQNLLGTTQGIGRLRKKFHDYKGVPVICTYHPAYLLRNPDAKREVWNDMKMLLEKMGRPVPAK